MFDFIYDNKTNILKNPEKFIIFVKRLLPKYANSLPDSAAIALFREIKKLKGSNNIIIETGVGASTIILFMASFSFIKTSIDIKQCLIYMVLITYIMLVFLKL